MKTQTYTKINSIFCRYQNLGKIELPNPKWKIFQNKIILDQYSEPHVPYLRNCLWDAYAKIDGTNSKIVYYPSTGECFCGGKTDNADIIGTGQKSFLDAIIERIKPILAELFPPESAKFAPVTNDKRQIQYYCPVIKKNIPIAGGLMSEVTASEYMVKLEEVPIYIYGEFYGKKIQAGGNYDKEKNRFKVFDICQQGWYVPLDMLHEYAEKLGLEVVPYLGQMTLNQIEDMVHVGFKTREPDAANPDYIEEGIVARPVIPIKDSRGNRIIIKVKHCDYADLDKAIEQVGLDEYKKFDAWYKEHQKEIETK